DFHHHCPGATISLSPPDLLNGSSNGLIQVLNNKVDIGTSDAYADPVETDLQDHQVAVVVFALVVNSKVTDAINLTNLTTDQIQAIYSGSVNNWYEVKSSSPQ